MYYKYSRKPQHVSNLAAGMIFLNIVSGVVHENLISCGSSHTCFIDTDGILNCQGENESYEQAPLQATAQGSFIQVSSAMMHTCAVVENEPSAVEAGMVRCWGKNDNAEAPFRKTRPDHPITIYEQVSAGAGGHTCGLASNGDIECWGSNFAGAAPGTISGPFSQVSAGTYHTCGVLSSKNIKCWGSNWFGQAPPLLETGNYDQVSSGFHHTCALHVNGTINCFGENTEKQCSTNLNLNVETYVQVTASGYHTCALKSDLLGVVCWGDNTYGQAPEANSTNSFTSVVAPAGHKFKSISGGATHSCAYMTDTSDVFVKKKCWGWNVSE
eukprot:g6254.t1